MWKKYEVELHFKRLVGAIPRDPKPGEGEHASTFKQDENGLHIDARYIRAHMRHCALILESASPALKELRVRVAGGICINPYNIYFGKTHPDGTLTRVARFICAGCKGPSEAVRSEDYVENQTLRFWLVVSPWKLSGKRMLPTDDIIDEAPLRQIFELGSEIGMGADKQDGEGHYELVTLKLVEEGEEPYVEKVRG